MRIERRQLMLMRASFAGVALLAVAFVLWALPWVPGGMTEGHYDPATAVAVGLGAATALALPLLVLVWGPVYRNETLPEFLRVLFGGTKLIRGREQFLTRLRAECRRAHRNRRYALSCIVIEQETAPESAGLSLEPVETNLPALRVRGAIRTEDIVAMWDASVWVLLPGANEEARDRVLARLARDLEPLEEVCSLGAATLGVDGDSAAALMNAATERLRPVAVGGRGRGRAA